MRGGRSVWRAGRSRTRSMGPLPSGGPAQRVCRLWGSQLVFRPPVLLLVRATGNGHNKRSVPEAVPAKALSPKTRPEPGVRMPSDVLARNNVRVFGRGRQPMLFAHGFGCDQNMWRFVTPAFEDDYRIVLFDYVGSGKSDLARLRRDAVREPGRLRRGRARRLPRARPPRRRLRRPLGERRHRHARRQPRSPAGSPGSILVGPSPALRERPARLRRRVRAAPTSRGCSR